MDGQEQPGPSGRGAGGAEYTRGGVKKVQGLQDIASAAHGSWFAVPVLAPLPPASACEEHKQTVPWPLCAPTQGDHGPLMTTCRLLSAAAAQVCSHRASQAQEGRASSPRRHPGTCSRPGSLCRPAGRSRQAEPAGRPRQGQRPSRGAPCGAGSWSGRRQHTGQ